MKNLKTFHFVFALLITLSACKKTDNDIQPSLSISPTQKELESGQGNFLVAVAANVKWIASTDKSWLSLSPVSGTGDGTIQVDYQINTSATPRTAVITFKGSSLEDKYLTVTQSGVSPFLTVTPQNQNVSAAAGSTKFAVSSNTNWIVSSDPLWCTLSQTSGTGNVELTATYQENTLSTQRTATLTFKVTGLDDPKATVTQAAFVPSLFVSPSNQNVGSAAGSTTFSVAANIAWTATSNHPEWCTLNTGGTGNGTINANFTENTSTIPRTADITVSGEGVLGQVVTVTQSGNTLTEGLVAYYPFNGNANDESGNGNNGTVNGASLTTDRKGNLNNAYYFDGINDWIELTDIKVGSHFSISFWVNPYVLTGRQSFVTKNNSASSSTENLFLVGYYTDYSLFLGNKEYICGNRFVGWHHIVVDIDNLGSNNVQAKVYQNSEILMQYNYAITLDIDNFNQSWSIGQEYDVNILTDFLNGNIDDVRFYNRGLSETEIQALYNE